MLLREHLSFSQANCVIESEDSPEGHSGKKLYLKGTFIQGGVRNYNERVYPVREIVRAVEAINKQLREDYSICGELDHPEELTINLDRVSHVITEMWMDGSNGSGKLRIVGTPSGNIVKALLEDGVKLGVSSRGVGNVDDKGEVSGFEIITVDIVARPSAPDAYPKPVFESSLNSRRGRIIEDLAKAVCHDPKAQKHLHKELLHWIAKL